MASPAAAERSEPSVAARRLPAPPRAVLVPWKRPDLRRAGYRAFGARTPFLEAWRLLKLLSETQWVSRAPALWAIASCGQSFLTERRPSHLTVLELRSSKPDGFSNSCPADSRS